VIGPIERAYGTRSVPRGELAFAIGEIERKHARYAAATAAYEQAVAIFRSAGNDLETARAARPRRGGARARPQRAGAGAGRARDGRGRARGLVARSPAEERRRCWLNERDERYRHTGRRGARLEVSRITARVVLRLR
jgi:hypothetical protein